MIRSVARGMERERMRAAARRSESETLGGLPVDDASAVRRVHGVGSRAAEDESRWSLELFA